MTRGFVVWFTGMSGTGKSTLASMLSAEIRSRGVHVEVLDGDEVRTHLSRGLGFSREDRDTNVRRIGFVAKLIARSGACAMTAAISPYRSTREEVRRSIDRFVEVYLRAPVDVLSDRDPKGLYKKALAGEIKNFTGIDDPYEPPESPDVELDTSKLLPDECLSRVVAKLEELGYLARRRDDDALPTPYGELPIPIERAGANGALEIEMDDTRAISWLASGLLSPVHGPMGSKDLTRVRKERRLERGLLFDATPTLAVPPALADAPPPSAKLVPRGASMPIADVDVAEVFRDEETGATLLGGTLVSSSLPEAGVARHTRARLDRLGATVVAGLFTERALHRGDEYLCRVALETCDALVVVIATASPRHRRAVRASLAAALSPERVIVIEMPDLPGASDGGLEIARAVVLRNAGASIAIAREEDGALARIAERGAKELAVSVRPPVATFSLPSGELRTARTLPTGGEAEEISWPALARALERGERPSPRLMSPEAVTAFLAVD